MLKRAQAPKGEKARCRPRTNAPPPDGKTEKYDRAHGSENDDAGRLRRAPQPLTLRARDDGHLEPRRWWFGGQFTEPRAGLGRNCPDR